MVDQIRPPFITTFSVLCLDSVNNILKYAAASENETMKCQQIKS